MPATALDSDRAQLAGRLRLAVTRLNRRLRQEAGTGLSATAESYLATIARRGPISMGELAAHEGVKPPSVCATLAGLEGQGLVSREVDPSDRRVSRVVATASGRHALDRSRGRKTAYLAHRMTALGERELAVLNEATAILERLIEEAR